MDTSSDGVSDVSYTHGQLSRVSSRLNQRDRHRFSEPSGLPAGSQPPVPVLSADACALTRSVADAGKVCTAQEYCLFCSTWLARKRKKKDTYEGTLFTEWRGWMVMYSENQVKMSNHVLSCLTSMNCFRDQVQEHVNDNGAGGNGAPRCLPECIQLSTIRTTSRGRQSLACCFL